MTRPAGGPRDPGAGLHATGPGALAAITAALAVGALALAWILAAAACRGLI